MAETNAAQSAEANSVATGAESSGSMEGSVDQAFDALVETGQLVTIVVDKLSTWLTGFIEMLPNLIVAALVVAFAALVARYGSRLLGRAARSATHNGQIASLVSTASKVAILASGFFVALGLLNLDKTVTSLLAGVGVVGLALGFAFQDIASNFMSGLILAVRRPFAIGDLVTTHDTMGTVDRVDLRATILVNFDGQRVTIPNKEVLQNPIVNFTRSGERRVDVAVGVAYDTNLEEAREVAIAAAESVEGRMTSKPVSVIYTGFGGSSIDMSVRFWIELGEGQADFLRAKSEAIIAIKQAFDEAGIGIPFPIRTLDFGEAPPEAWARVLGREPKSGATNGGGNDGVGKGEETPAEEGRQALGSDAA